MKYCLFQPVMRQNREIGSKETWEFAPKATVSYAETDFVKNFYLNVAKRIFSVLGELNLSVRITQVDRRILLSDKIFSYI